MRETFQNSRKNLVRDDKIITMTNTTRLFHVSIFCRKHVLAEQSKHILVTLLVEQSKQDGSIALFRDLAPPNHLLSNDMRIDYVGALLLDLWKIFHGLYILLVRRLRIRFGLHHTTLSTIYHTVKQGRAGWIGF